MTTEDIADIAVFIITRDDHVLLIQRKQRGEQPSHWVFPADDINAETVTKAAQESLNDLLGIRPDGLHVIDDVNHGASSITAYYIAADITTNFDLSDAILKTRWVHVNDVDDEINADLHDAVQNHLE